ncbi:MAG: cysteine desulfuration protein SufE [Flavobacteriales bacterium]|jgi:cysteine desulfuration protein SufE|tara:strand:- start:1863 stop:2276 length:414 start_codon:yes stop_codon:yes gene_type:complete
MSIQEVSGELIEDFELFEDWADKYEYIISLGKDLQSMNASDKTDENIVKGCQSQVWLTARNEDGIVFFDADSDAIITKGIIALLVKVFNGQSAKDILNNDLTFIDQIGLKEHLSPNRSNGLVAMVQKMKIYALAFSK